MAVIKLVEPYAVSQLRKDVRDAMMMTGEQAILLQLYHAGDPDATPCPQCGDDIYDSAEEDCNSCFGTMFDGGVRVAMKVWAVFTDHVAAEQLGKRGTFEPDAREIQLEAFPQAMEHDIVVRVRQWNANGTPAVVQGYYMLQSVQQRSLRTGNRFGQWSWDLVGQKANLGMIPNDITGITEYPVLGQTFLESLQITPASPTLPAHLVVEPDTKVVYLPFEAAPGGVEPSTPAPVGGNAFIFLQETPAATWTITHPLGYKPTVSVLVDGEEVDPDVDIPDTQVVIIIFGTPQAGEARLT